jgi:hypothetical protein
VSEKFSYPIDFSVENKESGYLTITSGYLKNDYSLKIIKSILDGLTLTIPVGYHDEEETINIGLNT